MGPQEASRHYRVVPVIAWFLTTRIGRAVATGLAVAGAIGVVVLRAFMAGKKAEREKQDRAALENLRNRAKKDDEVKKLDPDSRLERLNRWVSDDERGL